MSYYIAKINKLADKKNGCITYLRTFIPNPDRLTEEQIDFIAESFYITAEHVKLLIQKATPIKKNIVTKCRKTPFYLSA